MKKRVGNLFAAYVGDADYATVIPTNGEVDKINYAIMGAGVAYEAKTVWPEIPRALGKLLMTTGNHCYVLPVVRQPRAWVISFPTKANWKGRSKIELIERSAHELVALTDLYEIERVFLPRVGCGHGKLDWDRDVRPVLKGILDDRFTVVHDPAKEPPPPSRKPIFKKVTM